MSFSQHAARASYFGKLVLPWLSDLAGSVRSASSHLPCHQCVQRHGFKASLLLQKARAFKKPKVEATKLRRCPCSNPTLPTKEDLLVLRWGSGAMATQQGSKTLGANIALFYLSTQMCTPNHSLIDENYAMTKACKNIPAYLLISDWRQRIGDQALFRFVCRQHSWNLGPWPVGRILRKRLCGLRRPIAGLVFQCLAPEGRRSWYGEWTQLADPMGNVKKRPGTHELLNSSSIQKRKRAFQKSVNSSKRGKTLHQFINPKEGFQTQCPMHRGSVTCIASSRSQVTNEFVTGSNNISS